jgi:hypothetical protein
MSTPIAPLRRTAVLDFLMKTRVILSTLAAMGCFAASLEACTTAVVSGRAAPDGRPLLWKNRDINTPRNEVIRLDDGRYALVAVVNSGSRSSVWMGMNEAGLCIENSVCKDLRFPEEAKGLGNGGFMLQALRECATVADVKRLLEKTDQSGRSTNANFGVIDAQGGAALFETARNEHVMLDANDPQVAPQGYIVRSNFSLKGQKFECAPTPDMLDGLYSGERYLRANALLGGACESGIDARFLIRHAARDLASDDGKPYPGTINGARGDLPEFIPTKNTISRSTTVSYAVFQGVRQGEDPLLTTMWVGMGDPKFAATVPCWVAAGAVSEELTGSEASPLCQAAIELRGAFYSTEQNGISTAGLNEIWEEVGAFEEATFARVAARLEQWRKTGIDRDSMLAIHISASEQALAILRQQLSTDAPLPSGAGRAPAATAN